VARAPRARRYWLLKSEPEAFSFQDLLAAPRRRTAWEGIRNYQARNLLRDEMAKGDLALFYHSSAKPPGVAGVARIAGPAGPDPTQFDRRSDLYDPRSDPQAPTWLQVPVEAVAELPRYVPLDLLRDQPELRGMLLLRRGQRLSVQPVSKAEWRCVLALGGLDAGRF